MLPSGLDVAAACMNSTVVWPAQDLHKLEPVSRQSSVERGGSVKPSPSLP